VILTRLELYLRSRNLVLSEVARLAGYTPVHLRRLRADEATATRSGILAVTGAVRKLSRERITPGVLFERADAFLKGSGRRLSEAHRRDREVLTALLDEPVTPQLAERVETAGIASEAAVRHLLRTGRARLDTEPMAAIAIYEAAAHVATRLQKTPRQLATSLQAHALRGGAEALRMTGSVEEALNRLEQACVRFLDIGLCTDDAARVDYTRSAILYDLELWDDALPLARSARRRALQCGDTELAAMTEQIEAAVLFEQGDAEGAYKRWFALSKALDPPRNARNEEELARVWMNLGMCEIHRARPADARRWLIRASAAFRKLKNTAELARTRWNMATYVATFSEQPSRSLRLFRNAYRAFTGLQIWMDAGCVGLDMIDVMLTAKTPEAELTRHACDVADTLTSLPFAGGMRPALDLLRRIAAQKDRRRVVRKVRAALRDTKARCSEVSVAAVGTAGLGKAG
jgi:tetratricopeptide (TPR) repeat protein